MANELSSCNITKPCYMIVIFFVKIPSCKHLPPLIKLLFDNFFCGPLSFNVVKLVIFKLIVFKKTFPKIIFNAVS